MSGIETLLPYMEQKKGDKQDPTIIVDSREANTAAKVVEGLRERDVNVRINPLQKGDYILSDVCAVERKTTQDFVHTLTRRHLFKQLFKLKEGYPKPLILLEGYLSTIYKFSRIKPASVWGAMFKLAKNGVAMINTPSYQETIDFLYVAAYQEQIVEERVPTIHPVKKCETTSDAQIFFVASLPNIGRERAMSILKKYQTPLNAMTKVDEWGKAVHGLGPKITNKAKEVLTTIFEE